MKVVVHKATARVLGLGQAASLTAVAIVTTGGPFGRELFHRNIGIAKIKDPKAADFSIESVKAVFPETFKPFRSHEFRDGKLVALGETPAAAAPTTAGEPVSEPADTGDAYSAH